MATDDVVPIPTNIVMTMNETMQDCPSYDVLMKKWFHFDTLQLIRVLVTWFLFVLSFVGNSFVIWALSGSKFRHFVMFHLALSNIVYTVFVMPMDAIWNTTMLWIAGDALCRLTQMMKQFGMYASSFMVMVIALDRVTGILCPISYDNQRKRGFVMTVFAWCCSLACCVPAGIIFSVLELPTCEGILIRQCVDFLVIKEDSNRTPYYFFTMFISFILPLTTTIVSYTLIVAEISNMKHRDRMLMGRRNSAHAASMERAKKRTIFMRFLITLAFIICWGPYYGKGIYDWFIPDERVRPPDALDTAMYVMMYLNPGLHPFVFGIFMKEIRTKFHMVMQRFGKDMGFKGKKRINFSPRESFSSSTTATTHLHNNSRTSYHVAVNGNSTLMPSKKKVLFSQSIL